LERQTRELIIDFIVIDDYYEQKIGRRHKMFAFLQNVFDINHFKHKCVISSIEYLRISIEVYRYANL